MNPVQIWNNMWETLSDKSIAGFSIKKVMAAMALTVLLGLTIYYTDKSNLEVITGLWQGFIIGLVVTRAVEKVKGVSNQPTKEETPPQNL